MDLNVFDEQFIKFWKNLDFSTWNESDVREDFIAPLLRILGYAKGTVADITREQSLNLSEKYHRIGRKQVAVDYVPTVRLKKFWIIEAKPGAPREMNFGDYLQAHLYAIHPEIAARFIVLTNGWEIRVYDAISGNSWDDYLLKCTQEDCQDTFSELKEILSSISITKKLRSYILSTIEESLKVEVDEKIASDLLKEMNKLYRESIPVIRKNAQVLKMQEWKKRDDEANKWIQNISLDGLFAHMDNPADPYGWYGAEFVRRMKSASQPVRNDLIGKLAMRYRGRPHAIFKVQSVLIMCRLLEENIDAACPGYTHSVKDCLKELVENNMRYWAWSGENKIDNIGFALSHLDNICARLSYKIALRFALQPLKEMVTAQKQSLSAEDVIKGNLSVAREMMGAVQLIYEMIWRRFAYRDGKTIWNNIWNLQAMEKEIEQLPPAKYDSTGEADMLNFDHYGIDFDMQIFGTWTTLKDHKDKLLEMDAPDIVKDVLAKTREQILESLPQPLTHPPNWKMDEAELLKKLVELTKANMPA